MSIELTVNYNSPTFTEEKEGDHLVSVIHNGSLTVRGFVHAIRVPSDGEIDIGCKSHDEKWWRKFGLGFGVSTGINEMTVDCMKIAFDICCKKRPQIRVLQAKLKQVVAELDAEMEKIADEAKEEILKKVELAKEQQ